MIGRAAIALIAATATAAADPIAGLDPCLDDVVDRGALIDLIEVELGAGDPPRDLAVDCRGATDVVVHAGGRASVVALGDLPRPRRARALALAIADAVVAPPAPRVAAFEAPSATPAITAVAAPVDARGAWGIALRVDAGVDGGTTGIAGGSLALERSFRGATLRVGGRISARDQVSSGGGVIGVRIDGPTIARTRIGLEIAFEAGGVVDRRHTIDPSGPYAGGTSSVVATRALSARWDLTVDATYRYQASPGARAHVLAGGLGLRFSP